MSVISNVVDEVKRVAEEVAAKAEALVSKVEGQVEPQIHEDVKDVAQQARDLVDKVESQVKPVVADLEKGDFAGGVGQAQSDVREDVAQAKADAQADIAKLEAQIAEDAASVRKAQEEDAAKGEATPGTVGAPELWSNRINAVESHDSVGGAPGPAGPFSDSAAGAPNTVVGGAQVTEADEQEAASEENTEHQVADENESVQRER